MAVLHNKMTDIQEDDLADLAFGAAVLGTGGGGDPYLGRLMAAHAIRQYGSVELLPVNDLLDDDLIVPMAMMGAPTVIVEKLPSKESALVALRSLETYLGRPARAIMSLEAGGLNSTLPLALASEVGLPLVDADAMGRAFPELQMVTFTLQDIPATPMALADEKGNTIVLTTIDNQWTERLGRVITSEMGGAATIAIYPVTGKQLKEAALSGTISLIRNIGRAVREARSVKKDPILAIQDITQGYHLFCGKVIDIERETKDGFAKGKAILTGLDHHLGQTLTLEFQNEHLIARQGQDILATVPDLISVLDLESGDPITTEGMRYGLRVVVLGIPCQPKWRTPKGLALAGPRYFGYDLDFCPVEELQAKEYS